MSNMLDMIMDAKRRIEALGPAPPNFKLVQSPSALKRGPRVRTYAKRRAKSLRHWHRIDKKWLKRFGYRMEPTAYQLPDGRGNMLLVVHPILYPQYAKALRAGLTSMGMMT